MNADDLEKRRVEALERLSERTGDLSGVTLELLHEIRQEAVAEAAEVVTVMNADAKLEQHGNARRTAYRLAAATVGWTWFGVGIADWHAHRHLGLFQWPLTPVDGHIPVGLIFTAVSWAFVLGLLLASRNGD